MKNITRNLNDNNDNDDDNDQMSLLVSSLEYVFPKKIIFLSIQIVFLQQDMILEILNWMKISLMIH